MAKDLAADRPVFGPSKEMDQGMNLHEYSTYICNVMGLRSYERFFKVRQGFAFCIISSQQNIGWQWRERRSRVMRVVWTRGNRRRSRHFIHTPTFETDLYSAIVSVNHLFFIYLRRLQSTQTSMQCFYCVL